MKKFKVYFESEYGATKSDVVEASRFKVKNGCLVFYRRGDGSEIISKERQQFAAYKVWNSVEEL